MVQRAVDTQQQTPIDFQKDDSQVQSAVFWNKNMYVLLPLHTSQKMSSFPRMISQMNIIWFICIFYSRLLFYFICIFRVQDIVEVHKNAPPPPPHKKKKREKCFLKKANIQPLYQRSLSFACSIQLYLGKILPESSKIFVEHALHVTRIQFQPRPNNSALGKATRS